MGRPEPARQPHSGKRLSRPPRTAAPPHLTDSEAPPPSHRGRCRRHYLRSTRRARRARCLRGGRKVPSWPGLPPGEQCPNPTLLSFLSQTALSFPPFVTVSGHPAPAFQALLRREPRTNFRAASFSLLVWTSSAGGWGAAAWAGKRQRIEESETHIASVVRRSRRAAEASPCLDRAAPVVPAARTSRGSSAALVHLPDLDDGPPAALANADRQTPGTPICGAQSHTHLKRQPQPREK